METSLLAMAAAIFGSPGPVCCTYLLLSYGKRDRTRRETITDFFSDGRLGENKRDATRYIEVPWQRDSAVGWCDPER